MALLIVFTLIFDMLVLAIRVSLALVLTVPALLSLAFTPGQLNTLFLGWCRLIGIHVFKTTIHQRSSQPGDETATRPFTEDHVYAEIAAERHEEEQLRATAKAAKVWIGPGQRRWWEPLGTTNKFIYYLRISNWREK